MTTLDNEISIFGNSLADISATVSQEGFSGLKNLFANTSTSIVTEKDYKKLKGFNETLLETGDKTVALQKNMVGASKGARELALNADEAGVDLESLKTRADGVSGSMIGARIATLAFNAAISIGITLLTQLATYAFQKIDESIPTVENTTKWLKESSEAVKQNEADLKSLQDELQKTQNRIGELKSKSKDSLTLVESQELSKLEATNAALQTSIELQRKKIELSKAENQSKFNEAVNAKMSSSEMDENIPWWAKGVGLSYLQEGMNLLGFDAATNNTNRFSESLEEYKKFAAEAKELKDKARAALRSGDEEAYKNYSEQADKVQSKANEMDTWMSKYTSELTDDINQLGNIPYEEMTEETKQQVDYYNDVSNAYLAALGKHEQAFNNVYNQGRFKDAKGAIDAAIEENGGTLSGEQLKGLAESNDNVKAMVQNMQGVGVMADNSAKSFNGLANQITSAKEKTEALSKTPVTFSDLMSEKGTDSTPSFVERIEKYVEKFQKLQDALTKVENGTITNSEKNTLYKTFPELTQYANNLSYGINTLTDSMKTEVVSLFTNKLTELKSAGFTDEEISKYNAWANSVYNIADAVNDTSSILSSAKSALTGLDSAIQSYNSKGYFTIENLETLATTGQKYLQYLTYEDGQLKINTSAYQKLVNAELDELETKAVKQATTDLESLTSEAAATEYLAKANLDLADSELSAAEATFKYQLAVKLQEGGKTAEAAQKIANNLNTLKDIYASARTQVTQYADGMVGATTASEQLSNALSKQKTALSNAKSELSTQKTEMENQKTKYEDAKSAIESLIDWTEKYIKQVKNDEITALNKAKTAIDNNITAYKNQLTAQKELYEYNKNVYEKQNTVATDALAASIAALDTSSSGVAAAKKASDTLKSSRASLYDYLYTNDIDSRKDALDDYKTKVDKSYDDQITALNNYLNNEVQIRKDALKLIDGDQKSLYDKLTKYCKEHTTTTSAEFNEMWGKAQTAMQKYNTANLTTMDLMIDLQSKIYNIDSAIDTVSESISDYETKISKLQNQIDRLSESATTCANAINSVNSDNLEGDINANPNTNKTTKANNAPANLPAAPKWYFKMYDPLSKTDIHINSGKSNKEDAVKEIYNQWKKKNPSIGFVQEQLIRKYIRHFAKGTKSAYGGLAIVDEEGIGTELIPQQVSNGRYTILPQGNPVFSKDMTNELFDFANNPVNYIKDLLTSQSNSIKNIVGNNSVLSPSISIVVQGDATQSTINALRAESKRIIDEAQRSIMRTTIGNKRII